MELTTFSEPPSIGRILGFWLAALGLGSLLVMLFYLLTGNDKAAGFALYAGLYGTAFAACLSLPALLFLLLPLLPWAIGSDSLEKRWLRVFTLQSTSLALTGSVAHLLSNSSSDVFTKIIWPAATFYFLGGLVAAGWRFWPWLRPYTQAAEY